MADQVDLVSQSLAALMQQQAITQQRFVQENDQLMREFLERRRQAFTASTTADETEGGDGDGETDRTHELESGGR